MRIIPPTEPSASNPTLDRSREIIVFNPWRFADPDRVALGEALPYIYRTGQVRGASDYVRPGQGLGWLTDGRQCIVGQAWIEVNAPAEAER